jgi:hypothetical protein
MQQGMLTHLATQLNILEIAHHSFYRGFWKSPLSPNAVGCYRYVQKGKGGHYPGVMPFLSFCMCCAIVNATFSIVILLPIVFFLSFVSHLLGWAFARSIARPAYLASKEEEEEDTHSNSRPKLTTIGCGI